MSLTLTLQSVASASSKSTVTRSTVVKQIEKLLTCVKNGDDICQEESFDQTITTLERAHKQGYDPLTAEAEINSVLESALSSGEYDKHKIKFFKDLFNEHFNESAITAKELGIKIDQFIVCLKHSRDDCKDRAISELAEALVIADKNNVPKNRLAELVISSIDGKVNEGDISKERLQAFSDQLNNELEEEYTNYGRDFAAYTLGAAVGAVILACITVYAIALAESAARGTRFAKYFTGNHNLGYGAFGFIGSGLAGILVTGPMAIELSDSMANSMNILLEEDIL